MTIPFGLRADSIRTPKASRAGALYVTLRNSTPRHSTGVGHLAIPPYDAAAPQCDDEPCPRCSELEKQLAGARLALAVVKDALAAERGGR